MMTPAHLFGGYVALRATHSYWSNSALSKRQEVQLLFFGLLLSVAIDLDTLVTKGIDGHHKLLTHYPLFWLMASVFLFYAGKFLRKPFIRSLAVVTLITSWTHIALDLVGITMGVHLLSPFSMKEFSITPLTTNFASEQERWSYILSSPIMWIGDGIVIITGLIVMCFDYFRNHKQEKR